jgi:hypothetical protein
VGNVAPIQEMAMTTTTTTRRGTIGRWTTAGALAMALGLGMAAAAEAQNHRVQSAPPAVGSQVWGENGYQYQYTGRGYVATGLRKVHPYRNMPQVYDLYNGQTWLKRLDYREPGWVAVLTPAARGPISGVKWPVNQAATEQNSYFLLNNQHWVTMAQLRAMDGQRAPAPQICGDGINNQMACLGGNGTTPTITQGSGVGTGGQYVLGGNTAASQPGVTKAEVDAIMWKSQQRMIDVWLQPNCNSSYNGCR